MKSETYNSDCLEGMKQYPDNYFDLCVCDPPYGIGIDTKTASVIPNKSKNPIFKNKDWDLNIPSIEYFTELLRVSKNQIIWGGNHFLDILGNCKAPIIWDKLNGDSMYADGEFAWTSKNLPKNLRIFKHQWCGAFKASERKNVNIHPTQKPIKLYSWIYHNYLPNGGKVIDTHLGSGSNRIAADLAGNIDFTAYEIDCDYFRDEEKRYKIFKSQQRIML